MTQQEFEELQLEFTKSGKPIGAYLHDINLKYSK